MLPLTRIVAWSHQFATEILAPGDLAVDLTAGRGHDTLALARAVGGSGRVLAFDIQQTALRQTASLLEAEGHEVRPWPGGQALPHQSGIYLVHACHSSLTTILRLAPQSVIANLGYLPGGEPHLVTRPGTTCAALRRALELLTPKGRLTVTVYPAHANGDREAEAVKNLLSGLPGSDWQVLQLTVANQRKAPFLMIAERKRA